MARTADPAGTCEQTGNGRVNMARALGGGEDEISLRVWIPSERVDRSMDPTKTASIPGRTESSYDNDYGNRVWRADQQQAIPLSVRTTIWALDDHTYELSERAE
jgi:hypothetical protein